ncbi:MAG: DUF4159 domain-containing protein [Pseudomonadota bacterium]
MDRRRFLRGCGATLAAGALPARAADGPFDFTFTRLRYESGDWDVDERMPSNVLNSLVEYTTLRVNPEERVVSLADPAVLDMPFCYIAGHRPVAFTKAERTNFKRYVENGGFVFADDCNHDIDGPFAVTFEKEMAALFGENALTKLPTDHELYRSFFRFEDGPPATSFELNGWGDDLVHDYLKGITRKGRVSVLYSNKDYGCEWDYDYRNKRWLVEDNTRFAVNIVMYALLS